MTIIKASLIGWFNIG